VDRVISRSDVASCSSGNDLPDGSPRRELDELVGLKSVKEKVFEIVEQIKTQKRLCAKGRRVRRPSIHMLFTGNPGTGKTTVARIVARILRDEGILRKGHLIEVRGRDLCGEYIGQTAPKTSAVCRDAYGSVLFIDEAYSLFRGDGNDKDFGREALDTLIAEMENHRDDLCVIMAGYTDEMETMLGGNSGLKSRIPFTVDFPNYTKDELWRIFFAMVGDSFEYEKPLEKAVRTFFDGIPDEAISGKGFSNARFVRNLYERTWGKAAYRSRLDDGEIKILASDLAGAAEEREFRQLLEKTVRKPIGFGAWAG
jgi:AAA+ superfamily predicted ATPase